MWLLVVIAFLGLVAILGGISVQRLIDPTIPASLLTDAVKALFRAPGPEAQGGSS